MDITTLLLTSTDGQDCTPPLCLFDTCRCWATMWLRISHRVRRNHMAKTVVRACIDKTIKDEAAAVLAAMGLTVSDAFRLLLVRIAREKALPFEPLVPNAETIEAMKAARRGELVTVGSVDQLFADLHADDEAYEPL